MYKVHPGGLSEKEPVVGDHAREQRSAREKKAFLALSLLREETEKKRRGEREEEGGAALRLAALLPLGRSSQAEKEKKAGERHNGQRTTELSPRPYTSHSIHVYITARVKKKLLPISKKTSKTPNRFHADKYPPPGSSGMMIEGETR